MNLPVVVIAVFAALASVAALADKKPPSAKHLEFATISDSRIMKFSDNCFAVSSLEPDWDQTSFPKNLTSLDVRTNAEVQKSLTAFKGLVENIPNAWLYMDGESQKTRITSVSLHDSRFSSADKYVRICLSATFPSKETQIILSLAPFPVQKWKIEKCGTPECLKFVAEVFVQNAKAEWKLTESRQDFKEMWACPWFKADKQVAPDPKDYSAEILTAPGHERYLIAHFSECLGGEYVPGPRSSFFKETKGKWKAVKGGGRPIVDIDGDGFPEFVTYHQYGGGGYSVLEKLIPSYRILSDYH